MKVKTRPTIAVTREEQKRIKDFVEELYNAYKTDVEAFTSSCFPEYVGDIVDSIASDMEDTSYSTVIEYED